jgi:predicted metal-dependent hydrolase
VSDVTVSETEIIVGGRSIPLTVRHSARARRISLRLDPPKGAVVLTVPRGVRLATALAFARDKAVWAANRLAHLPRPVAFAHGVTVPYLGTDHVIIHAPGTRGGVWREDGRLLVSGAIEHLPRRLTDWFKSEAKQSITPRARAMAESIGQKVAKVTVRDTRSRWGSCSSTGALNFSWRLILAPEAVFDYVIAHEVSHLQEMNHSARFWAVVERLCPDPDPAKAWLRKHGAGLHLYGG